MTFFCSCCSRSLARGSTETIAVSGLFAGIDSKSPPAKSTTNFGSDIPFTSEEKGVGYLQFNKHGVKIEIGGVDTRPFRLLRRLCDPFESHWNVEEVFRVAGEG